MTTSAERSKEVKRRLALVFGTRNVRVHKGTGTASHWIEATVTIPRPEDCTCSIREPDMRTANGCLVCRERESEANKDARFVLKDIKFPTYCSDDGYNQDRDCFILQIRTA